MPSVPGNPMTAAPLVPPTEPAQRPGPEPLVGQHALLERLTQAHYADLYASMCADPAVWTWWPDDPPNDRAAFDTYLDDLLKLSEDLAAYAVSPRAAGPLQGKALGLALAMSENRDSHRRAELGAFFGPSLQRTRAATEALYLLAGRMFDLNHRRMAWTTNALNRQSRRAAERFGFVHEGTLRQDKIIKGRNRDSMLFSILDSEWPLCKRVLETWLEDANFDEQEQQKVGVDEIRARLKSA